MHTSLALLPELIFYQNQMQRGYALVHEGPTITHICPQKNLAPDISCLALPGRALLPGLVNAHSHAFQRAMRGRTQHPTPGQTDSFWSWREAMYAIALKLSPEGVYDIARLAFLDMLRAGFTSVGEFHYLHHQQDGQPYDNPNEIAEAVMRAAQNVGIRIMLLRVAYARAGFNQSAHPRQRRFIESSPEVYLKRLEALAATALQRDPEGQSIRVGMAPHSIRALDDHWLRSIAEYARASSMPVHMHVSEQRKELEQCVAEHGATPLAHVHEVMDLSSLHFTAVHGTHLSAEEIALMAEHQAVVCACPITERDLGDGFLPGIELNTAGVRICIGSDSHCQIDPFTELRLIEYHERLRRESRNLFRARELFAMGSLEGARALGLPCGVFEPGQQFDAFCVDLSHRTLLGCRDEDVLSALVFAADPGAVTDVFVGGKRRLENGEHPEQDAIEGAYVRRLKAL